MQTKSMQLKPYNAQATCTAAAVAACPARAAAARGGEPPVLVAADPGARTQYSLSDVCMRHTQTRTHTTESHKDQQPTPEQTHRFVQGSSSSQMSMRALNVAACFSLPRQKPQGADVGRIAAQGWQSALPWALARLS